VPFAFWTGYLPGLAIVGAILFGLYAIARTLARRRLFADGDARLVSVVASTFVSQNTSIHVIKAGERYLLVGGGAGQVRTLGELAPAEVEAWREAQRRA
jgi:flagellar biogenesis protein FliO